MANKKHLAILNQGVDIWNEWRKENPQIVPDLRGANLFKKDLQGINLTKADIRSTNFAKANLTEADFNSAKAGLNRWGICYLLIISWFIATWCCLYLLVLSITINNDPKRIYDNISKLANSFLGDLSYDIINPNISNFLQVFINYSLTILLVTIIILFTIYGIAIATAILESAFVHKIFHFVSFSTLIFLSIISLYGGVINITIIPLIFSVIGFWIGFNSKTKNNYPNKIIRFFISTINKHSTDFVFGFGNGTNFYYANLTQSDFTNVLLKNSNFNNAIVTHTNWYNAKKISSSKFNKTILNDEKILSLLVTHNGKNKSYSKCNLRGANLINVNLNNADLELADISEAILENADLENANLSKVQALNTNFRRANLTGACIEDWNVNNQTNFNDIVCKYIYLDKNKKRRSPNQGEFAPGEFTKFYLKAFNTIELIFAQDIDWQSFLTSFNNEYNNVINNYNKVLKIIENKYEAQILSKNEQIQEYKEEIKHLRRRIEILNKSILELSSISREEMPGEDNG